MKASASKKKSVMKNKVKYVYLNNSVKDYSMADAVRISPGPRGILMSFSKEHPDVDGVVVFQEVLLPYDVAHRLNRILHEQIGQLVEQKLLTKETLKVSEEGKDE